MNVAVCDYGAGNVRSVVAAFRRLGADVSVTSSPADIEAADLAVLPGVGSAASAMDGLRERGLDEALRRRVGRRRLHARHLPGPAARARGVRGGRRRRRARAPSRPSGQAPRGPRPAHRLGGGGARRRGVLLRALVRGGDARCDCALRGVVAVAEAGSFLGVQFHPEKSGAAGARLLERCLSRA